jgi:hypothetical protein
MKTDKTKLSTGRYKESGIEEVYFIFSQRSMPYIGQILVFAIMRKRVTLTDLSIAQIRESRAAMYGTSKKSWSLYRIKMSNLVCGAI